MNLIVNMKQIARKKAQLATEFLVLLAVLLLFLVLIVTISGDLSTSLFGFSSSSSLQELSKAPVGVTSIVENSGVVYVSLVNNQRFSIIIHNVTLDNVLLNASGPTTLESGEETYYISSLSALPRKQLVSVKIYYRDDEDVIGTQVVVSGESVLISRT